MKSYRFVKKPTPLLLAAMRNVTSYSYRTSTNLIYHCEEFGISWVKLKNKIKINILDKHLYLLACIKYGDN